MIIFLGSLSIIGFYFFTLLDIDFICNFHKITILVFFQNELECLSYFGRKIRNIFHGGGYFLSGIILSSSKGQS
uniref:Uncharacterized protein n=1 Tax=Haematobia irritans TaxID=7368 RepID=A0A1L8E5Y7_HAEIR